MIKIILFLFGSITFKIVDGLGDIHIRFLFYKTNFWTAAHRILKGNSQVVVRKTYKKGFTKVSRQDNYSTLFYDEDKHVNIELCKTQFNKVFGKNTNTFYYKLIK